MRGHSQPLCVSCTPTKAQYQRRIFDAFCREHNVDNIAGNWQVYKGVAADGSPSHKCTEQTDGAYKDLSNGARVFGTWPFDTWMSRDHLIAVDAHGGMCDVNSRRQCGVGVHFCFSISAAQEWGYRVLVFRVPPTAIVCIPVHSRQYAQRGKACAFSHIVKARASRLIFVDEVQRAREGIDAA